MNKNIRNLIILSALNSSLSIETVSAACDTVKCTKEYRLSYYKWYKKSYIPMFTDTRSCANIIKEIEDNNIRRTMINNPLKVSLSLDKCIGELNALQGEVATKFPECTNLNKVGPWDRDTKPSERIAQACAAPPVDNPQTQPPVAPAPLQTAPDQPPVASDLTKDTQGQPQDLLDPGLGSDDLPGTP